MNLKDLSSTERLSLIGGQFFRAFNLFQAAAGDGSNPAQADEHIKELKQNLHRILDLIEESDRGALQ